MMEGSMWKGAGLESFSVKRRQVGKGAPWDMQGERGFLLKVGALIAASPQLQGVCALYCAQPLGESSAGISGTKFDMLCLASLEQGIKPVCSLQPPHWCFASCLVKQSSDQ